MGRIFGLSLGGSRSFRTLENQSLTQILRGFSSVQAIQKTLMEHPQKLDPRFFGKSEIKILAVDNFFVSREGGSHLRRIQFKDDPVVCAVSRGRAGEILRVGIAYSSKPVIHLVMMKKVTEIPGQLNFKIFGGRNDDVTQEVFQALFTGELQEETVNFPGPAPITAVIFDPLTGRIVYTERNSSAEKRSPRKINRIRVFEL